jgi:hypothetical protein
MSAGNFHRIADGSVERNGTAAPTTISPRGARRPAPSKRIERAAKTGPEPAGFVKAELQAHDAAMWPIHPVMWLQPELRLAVPASSGLHIERKHTVPSPEFLRTTMMPISRPPSLDKTVHPVSPHIKMRLPGSDLAPLGWDPRVASHAIGKGDQE